MEEVPEPPRWRKRSHDEASGDEASGDDMDDESSDESSSHDQQREERPTDSDTKLQLALERCFCEPAVREERMRSLVGEDGRDWVPLSSILESVKEECGDISFSDASRALKKSWVLEVEENKVRRRWTLAKIDPESVGVSVVYAEPIDPDVDEVEVSRIFGKCGTVKEVQLPRDRNDPKRRRGFAFVEYDDARGARRACSELDNEKLFANSDLVTRVITRAEWAALRERWNHLIHHPVKVKKKPPPATRPPALGDGRGGGGRGRRPGRSLRG